MKHATRGRILIVDDEIPLLTLMEQYLARLGYQVEAFSSAKAAFERLGTDPAAYSLVIADVTLPEISGPAMIRQLLEQNANLRVLVCTGSPFVVGSIPEPLRSRVELLQKPFAPAMLAEAVRRLLQEAGSAGAGGAQGSGLNPVGLD